MLAGIAAAVPGYWLAHRFGLQQGGAEQPLSCWKYALYQCAIPVTQRFTVLNYRQKRQCCESRRTHSNLAANQVQFAAILICGMV